MRYVVSSSSGILDRSISIPRRAIKSVARCNTVNVFSPKKSNLTKPAFSAHFIVNCVTGISDRGSRYNGTSSASGRSPITKPAACVEACRYKPSSFIETVMRSATCSSSSFWARNAGSDLSASAIVVGFAGLLGISFAIRSTCP